MRLPRNRERGDALIEFTLAGIPLIFLLLSTFEMARGMWIYHTLTFAVKEGTRFAIVHGKNCTTAPNSCGVTIGQVAQRVRSAGPGLISSEWNMTFSCLGSTVNCRMDQCVSDATAWPSAPGNTPGMDVTISSTYPYRSLITMFWGGHKVNTFGTFNLPASSKEKIQF